MTKTLTPEKLVLFVYDEISDPQERDEISTMVKVDNEAYALVSELAAMRDTIERSDASPSENSIQSILNYSRALSVVHMKNHRTMGLVLN